MPFFETLSLILYSMVEAGVMLGYSDIISYFLDWGAAGICAAAVAMWGVGRLQGGGIILDPG